MAPRPKHNYDKPVVQAEIIARMSNGESATSICKLNGFPDWATLMRWLREDESFRDKYAQAREDMLDFWMMQSRDIAEDTSRDYQDVTETIETEKGTTVKTKRTSDNSASMRDRLRVDTIHKTAARMMPKKYSERIQQELSGPSGEALSIVVNVREKDK